MFLQRHMVQSQLQMRPIYMKRVLQKRRISWEIGVQSRVLRVRQVQVRACTHAHIHTHAHTHTHIRAHTHTHTHGCITRTRTYTHTHTHTDAPSIHTRTLACDKHRCRARRWSAIFSRANARLPALQSNSTTSRTSTAISYCCR